MSGGDGGDRQEEASGAPEQAPSPVPTGPSPTALWSMLTTLPQSDEFLAAQRDHRTQVVVIARYLVLAGGATAFLMICAQVGFSLGDPGYFRGFDDFRYALLIVVARGTGTLLTGAFVFFAFRLAARLIESVGDTAKAAKGGPPSSNASQLVESSLGDAFLEDLAKAAPEVPLATAKKLVEATRKR